LTAHGDGRTPSLGVISEVQVDEQIELLRKILDTLTLIAEPQIAQRDEKLRNALLEIVGKGQLKIRAASLMDGNRTQSIIAKEAGIDAGGLSRLIKALRDKGLINSDDKPPKMTIPLSPNFWAELEKQNGR
jgi:CRP-like cAMP-binding protein